MKNHRIINRGGFYHVYLRGAKKEFLFNDDWDCNKFIYRLRMLLIETGNQLVVYTLMPNHYHLIIKARSRDQVVKMMHRLGTYYAIHYNKKYQTCGCVFQSRYQSKEIKSPSYLLYLTRYIHRNPIEAGLVSDYDLEMFKWSSLRKYFDNNLKSPVKLSMDLIHEYFETSEKYKEFLFLTDYEAKVWCKGLYWRSDPSAI
jgi:REP element-mobilizing transposase RayT